MTRTQGAVWGWGENAAGYFTGRWQKEKKCLEYTKTGGKQGSRGGDGSRRGGPQAISSSRTAITVRLFAKYIKAERKKGRKGRDGATERMTLTKRQKGCHSWKRETPIEKEPAKLLEGIGAEGSEPNVVVTETSNNTPIDLPVQSNDDEKTKRQKKEAYGGAHDHKIKETPTKAGDVLVVVGVWGGEWGWVFFGGFANWA